VPARTARIAFKETFMKLLVATTVLACSALGATLVLPAFGDGQDAKAAMRQLFEQDVAMYAAERGPADGAPGASASGFQVSKDVQGMALIVGLDQPVLGVFVALNVPNKHIAAPYEDLQVAFTLADGSVRTVKPAGGGGAGMLFQSPEDVPMTSLRKVALLVDKGAKWAK
jgi:hypothetical protein